MLQLLIRYFKFPSRSLSGSLNDTLVFVLGKGVFTE